MPLLLLDERKTVNTTVELPMSEKIDYNTSEGVDLDET